MEKIKQYTKLCLLGSVLFLGGGTAFGEGLSVAIPVVSSSGGAVNCLSKDCECVKNCKGAYAPPESEHFVVTVNPSCFVRNLRKISNPLQGNLDYIEVKFNFLTGNSSRKYVSLKVPPKAIRSAADGRQYTNNLEVNEGNFAIVTSGLSDDTNLFASYKNQVARYWVEGTKVSRVSGISVKQVYRQVTPQYVAPSYFRGNRLSYILSAGLAHSRQNTPDPEVRVIKSALSFDSSKSKQYFNSGKNQFNIDLVMPGSRSGGGQFGCQGYYSPLMLFFTEARPKFRQISKFPLFRDQSIYWPEAKHVGYFLVRDQDKNNKITKGSELFRNHFNVRNGFEDLKRLDSNKDNRIDKRDKMFSQLKLWKDINGNGIGESNELISLRDKGIQWISLKYRSHLKKFGDRAQARQVSTFTYMDMGGSKRSLAKNPTQKKDQLKKAKIVDIWFSPVPRALAQALINKQK